MTSQARRGRESKDFELFAPARAGTERVLKNGKGQVKLQGGVRLTLAGGHMAAGIWSAEFWDNLISIKPSLSGEQTAGWQPGPPAMTGLGCHLLSNRRIPVDGGVTLSTDVYIPKTPGRYPAIVQFAAYRKELRRAGVPTGNNEIGSPPVFTDRGYAQVVVSPRGISRSAGEPGVFFNPQDVEDHARCIAWAAEQSWCDGDVVLFGTSYYGMTQPLIAIRNRLQKGEKLRFDVAGRTDLLKSNVGHGYVHFNMLVPPYFSRNTLHYGAETYIELQRILGT
jgi:hypothetical protein